MIYFLISVEFYSEGERFYSLTDALVVATVRTRVAGLLEADTVAGGVQKHRVAIVAAKAFLDAGAVT